MYKRIKQVLAVFMIFSLIVSYVNLHVLAKEDAEIILHQGETYKIPMSDMLISQKEKSDVVFYSENELVAEVDKEGLVTAIIPGNTFIVCESKVKDATPSQLEVHKWKVEVLEDKELNKSIEQKNAASVNGIEYLTLQEAVDSSNDEDVILLLRDTRESVVSSGKNFSLNLMGNTLSAETGKRTAMRSAEEMLRSYALATVGVNAQIIATGFVPHFYSVPNEQVINERVINERVIDAEFVQVR